MSCPLKRSNSNKPLTRSAHDQKMMEMYNTAEYPSSWIGAGANGFQRTKKDIRMNQKWCSPKCSNWNDYTANYFKESFEGPYPKSWIGAGAHYDERTVSDEKLQKKWCSPKCSDWNDYNANYFQEDYQVWEGPRTKADEKLQKKWCSPQCKSWVQPGNKPDSEEYFSDYLASFSDPYNPCQK